MFEQFCFGTCSLGDVLQLPVSLRGALLLPGARADAEGLRGRHRPHVHS